MPPRLHQIGVDHGFTQPFCGFQSMQALDQNVTFTIVTHLDRRFHAILQNVLGQYAHSFGMQRLATRGRHVDVVDRDLLDSKHVSPA